MPGTRIARGCGQSTDRDFLPGHDVRAIQARVREHFGGFPLKFIQWVDGAIRFGQTVTASAPKVATVMTAKGDM